MSKTQSKRFPAVIRFFITAPLILLGIFYLFNFVTSFLFVGLLSEPLEIVVFFSYLIVGLSAMMVGKRILSKKDGKSSLLFVGSPLLLASLAWIFSAFFEAYFRISLALAGEIHVTTGLGEPVSPIPSVMTRVFGEIVDPVSIFIVLLSVLLLFSVSNISSLINDSRTAVVRRLIGGMFVFASLMHIASILVWDLRDGSLELSFGKPFFFVVPLIFGALLYTGKRMQLTIVILIIFSLFLFRPDPYPYEYARGLQILGNAYGWFAFAGPFITIGILLALFRHSNDSTYKIAAGGSEQTIDLPEAKTTLQSASSLRL